MRELARIVRIDGIRPIEGADAIEAAQVGGWTVVIKKGEFVPGDRAVYLEIDSFLPEGNPAWQFLIDKSARIFNGVNGHVLRTVRLRGQCSQGLLLSLDAVAAGLALDDVPDGLASSDALTQSRMVLQGMPIGWNLTDALGVQKYEPPIPAEIAGEVRGLFPSRVPKTDQERIQNLAAEIQGWLDRGLTWEVTEKLEGSSVTWAWLDEDLHVCSRNLDLRESESNTLWRLAQEHDIARKIKDFVGKGNLALQGEIVGTGVQGNIYKLSGQRFYLYDVYDVDQGRYLCANERSAVAQALGLNHVPVLHLGFSLADLMPVSAPTSSSGGADASSVETIMQGLLRMADGESALKPGQLREGLVFKAIQENISFKVISNKYLLKQKD